MTDLDLLAADVIAECAAMLPLGSIGNIVGFEPAEEHPRVRFSFLTATAIRRVV